MNSINYNHLYNFYQVARSGSLKTAALNLGLSQSTLSEQMSSLEKAANQKLFSRVGRNLSLNVFGRQLYGKIEGFFSTSQDLFQSSDSGLLSSQSSIEIGITTAMSKIFAFEILKPIFRESGALVRITESAGDTLLMQFKEQKIDLFITHEKLSRSLVKRLRTVSLKKPRLLLVGGKNFEKLALQFPKDLSGYPFYLFTVKSQLRWETEIFFKSQKITPQVKGEVDDPEIIKAAVLDNLGLAILPEHAVKSEINDKQLFQIGLLPQTDFQIYAHYHGEELSEDMTKLVSLLEKS
jgi:LysR family transcriptional activator of nhaA